MVKIEIDGNVLALSPAQKIRFKLRNPMMYEDVLPKYYSFPFTIPLDNGTNSFILNYPQVWNNRIRLTRKLDCLVYLFGENNARRSVLNIRNVTETTAECDIIIDKNVDDIAEKKLSDIDMGTIVLEDSVYCEQYISIRIEAGYTPSGNFELIINDMQFSTPQIAYTGPSYFSAVYNAFVSQINAASIGITASLEDPYGTGVYFLGLKSDNPGTQNAFKFNNIQTQLASLNSGDANYAWNFFPGTDPDNTGAEFEWIEQHLKAIRSGIKNCIDTYNPDTMPVTFPLIENVKFIDDTVDYYGFQNSQFTEGLADKNKLSFITPMPQMVYVIKKVFKALGFDAAGSFFEDENIKRFILYTNIASDYFQEIHGLLGGAFPPDLAWLYGGKVVNIHASVITISKHCPDITVKEFLTEIRKLFNLKYEYDIPAGKVEVFIAQTKSENLIQNAKDFTANIVNKWQLQNPSNKNETIKLFKFEADSNDEKQKQLGELDYQKQLVIDAAAKKEITPKISSIGEEVVGGFSMVPAVQISGVYNNQGTPAKLKLLQYYHIPTVPEGVTVPAWAKIETDTEPFLMPFAFNKDSYPMFSYTSNWSLRWDTEKGFYKKCWEKQTQLLNDGVQLKIAMTYSAAELLAMEKNPYQRLDGSLGIWKDIDVELGGETIPPAECIFQLL